MYFLKCIYYTYKILRSLILEPSKLIPNYVSTERRRPRREVYPKPPPYSEAPPRYETIQTPVDLRPSPNSTDPILPGTVERNVTSDRRQRVGQNRRQRRNNLGRNAIEPSPIDAPPPYVSVVDVESPIHQTARYSAGPSTSGAASQNHGVTPFIEDIDGRNGRGSPHPSLASADIHLATDHERGHRLHRTVSERSPFVTPLPTVGGATLRVVGSGTPVTIREITVHSQLIQNMHGTNGREQTRNVSFQQPEAVHRNTRIPRPVPRVKTVNTDQTTNEPSLNSVQKLDRRVRSGAEAGTSDITNVHPRHNNPAKSVSNKRLKTENTTTVLPSAVSNSNSKRLGHKTVTATDDNLSAEDLSTNLKPSMAVRREKRQAILVKLRERKQNISPTNSQ